MTMTILLFPHGLPEPCHFPFGKWSPCPFPLNLDGPFKLWAQWKWCHVILRLDIRGDTASIWIFLGTLAFRTLSSNVRVWGYCAVKKLELPHTEKPHGETLRLLEVRDIQLVPNCSWNFTLFQVQRSWKTRARTVQLGCFRIPNPEKPWKIINDCCCLKPLNLKGWVYKQTTPDHIWQWNSVHKLCGHQLVSKQEIKQQPWQQSAQNSQDLVTKCQLPYFWPLLPTQDNRGKPTRTPKPIT